MLTIKTHLGGWGVFHPDWCEGRQPIFGGAGTCIWDCIAYKVQADREG